jgi:hypothetical protein
MVFESEETVADKAIRVFRCPKCHSLEALGVEVEKQSELFE